jgi:citrate synthase
MVGQRRNLVNIDCRINVSVASGEYYLTAAQAAAALGVSRATLYAYASRGQIRSEALPGRVRERRYSREDIERLRERKAARRDPTAAAARGLHWGGPVLDSGITLIHDGRLYYRGRDAIALAGTATVEQAAAVLWQADAREQDRLFGQPDVLSPRRLAQIRRASADPFVQLQSALPLAASLDHAAYDLRPPAVRLTGARIVRMFTAILTRRTGPIHRALQMTWAPGRAAVADVIRAALILCADHELNVSAFTARCAASAGASPYDVISAAMATLKGFKHGGAAERVLSLARECGTPAGARAAVGRRLRRGEHVPGFGHPLYPAGDPRASMLLRLADAGTKQRAWVLNLRRAGASLLHDRPNLDFGLAAVTAAYALPAHAPLLLFGVGRTIGWIAHAMEEYASGRLIRPRARYVGPAPEGVG